MPFPEPERFRIKDLATRWGLSEEDVCDQIRTGHFKTLIVYRSQGGGFTQRYYISHRYHPSIGFPIRMPSRSTAEPMDKVAESHIHSILEFPWPGEGETLYIPRTEVEAFEKENKIVPILEVITPTTGDFTWIQNKPLRAAVEVYYELYSLKRYQPKQSHKKQIFDWLEIHYRSLSQRTKDSIATLVNPNKKGGAPPNS